MDEITAAWLEYAAADLETAAFLYEKQWPRHFSREKCSWASENNNGLGEKEY